MKRFLSRRVTRLERLLLAYLRRREEKEAGLIAIVQSPPFRQLFEEERERARSYLANICALVLYGEPRMDEPLTEAWKRCCLNAAWRPCQEICGCLPTCDDGQEFCCKNEQESPFDVVGLEMVGVYVRKCIIRNFPGAGEAEKLEGILSIAPAWLLWFTHSDQRAKLVDLKLQDLSEVRQFARADQCSVALPIGPFQYNTVPGGIED